MKQKQKVFLAMVSAVLLVAMSVLGTLAYLTDKDDIKNTFTVGQVYIKLDEEIVDEMGEPTGEGRTEDGNKYHLLPGHTYKKDPTVTVEADSEEAFIRMIMTINEQADLDAIFAPGVKLDTILTGYDASKWMLVDEKEVGDTRVYEFRYYKTVNTVDKAALPLEPLFTAIEMPTYLTNEDMAKLDNLKIDIEAHAIQADGFEGNADKAWEAFDEQMNP